MVAINRRFLDGSVHPLDLAIRPRMVGFGQAMLNTIGSSRYLIETVWTRCSGRELKKLCPAVAQFFGRFGELDAVSVSTVWIW